MLKAHNISFLRLLTVGYISSETYHAVKEYGTIGNLSVDKLESFSDKVSGSAFIPCPLS